MQSSCAKEIYDFVNKAERFYPQIIAIVDFIVLLLGFFKKATLRMFDRRIKMC